MERNEKHRRQRRQFDGDPQDTQIVRHGDQEHGEHKRRYQKVELEAHPRRDQLTCLITPQISGAVGGGQQTDESAEHEHQRRQPVHSQRVRESRWDVAPKELVRRCHAQAKREREAADQGRLVEFARAAQGSNRGRDERNTECPDEEVHARR